MAAIKHTAEKIERSPGTPSYLASERALIQYLSTLSKNKSDIKSFDFAFVKYLLEDGADINYRDESGQSAFHIVAKFLNTEVARFLLDQGANINAQDCLGRSPLHDAATLNCVNMVEFLLNNGADLNIKTFNKEQTPIHFAAKNGSCQTVRILLAHGADINSLDSKKRSPLQVAAEMNRAKVAELLISEGASAAIYDADGNSALTLLTEKLPDVAIMALNQLHSVDYVNRKEYFFLNSLEGWRMSYGGESAAFTPLEIAVQNRWFAVVMHPVVQRLVKVKWNNYGRRGAISNLMLNLFYVILWSVMSIVLCYKSNDLYFPLDSKCWRLAIVIIIIIITVEEIRRQVADTIRVRQQRKDWIEWRARALEDDLVYCHPQCPEERNYLTEEVKSLRNQSCLSTDDGWIYVDWLAFLLIIATITTHIVFLKLDTILAYQIHSRVLIGLLLILWIRIAKFVRPFQSTGPIVVIFAEIMKDIIKCAFLFEILFIPFACAFWVTYGANSPKPVKGYSSLLDLLYNMLCMVVGIDFPFDDLLAEDACMARILCSAFIISTAIVAVNLLIALLSDTFTRLYSNAVANATMQRAQSILALERTLGKKRKKDYYQYLRDYCSPQVTSMDHESVSKKRREKANGTDQIVHEMKKMSIALRRLQAKSIQNQHEAGKSVTTKSINCTISQLLKQSQENTVKIDKMYEIIMKRKKSEEKPVPSSPQNSLVLRRRCDVLSSVSLESAVFGCYELIPTISHMSTAIPSEKIERKERTIVEKDEGKRESLSSVEGHTYQKNNSTKEAILCRQINKVAVCSTGVDNKGSKDNEIHDSHPCSSKSVNEENYCNRGAKRISLRRNGTLSLPTDIPLVLPRHQHFLYLDDAKSSSDESISL